MTDAQTQDEDEIRREVDIKFARLQDAIHWLSEDAPLNPAEQAWAALLASELLDLAPAEKGR
jgi:hypothetical protein